MLSRAGRRLLAAQSSTPVNYCLQASNAALLVGCVMGSFFGTIAQFQTLRDDLGRLHRTAHTKATPCALPVPSAAMLSMAIGHGQDDLWYSVPDEGTTAEDLQMRLCGSTSIYKALAFVMHNASIVYTPDEQTDPSGPVTYSTAESSFLDALCGQDSEHDTFGDLRERIARAYLHSNAAFVKMATGCAFAGNPFSAGACSAADAINAQLTAAAADTAAGGFGEVPDTGVALYRLLALSVAGYYDRSLNGNGCFGNAQAFNASYFCADTYAERPANCNSESSTKLVELAGKPGYEALARSQKTCSERTAAYSSPPSPPPIPLWPYPADMWAPSAPEMASCVHSLQFGLLDQRRLFGVPDPVGSFQYETSDLPRFSKFIFDRHGLSEMKKASSDSQLDRKARLRMYAYYRLKAVTTYAMLTNAVIGFFFGFASIPTVIYLLTRVVRVAPPTIQIRPPAGAAFTIAAFLGVFAWFWGVFVDGAWHRSPYYTDQECGSWAASVEVSSPWLTTDGNNRGARSWSAWTTLAVTAYAVVYMYALRKYRAKSPKYRYVADRSAVVPFSIFTTGAFCTVLALIADGSADRWFVKAVALVPSTSRLEVAPLEDVVSATVHTPSGFAPLTRPHLLSGERPVGVCRFSSFSRVRCRRADTALVHSQGDVPLFTCAVVGIDRVCDLVPIHPHCLYVCKRQRQGG